MSALVSPPHVASLETAHAAVLRLIERFENNLSHYLSPAYQEAELRHDFLDGFFVALGWDVYHTTQTNPAEQEVKIERGVTVAAAQKRADYAFYLAPNFRDPRFFAEAKKPSIDLLNNADAHFQTLRYGWSAGTPLALLTDFETFVALDCRARPDIRNALERAWRVWRYTDLRDRERFAELYWLFSREALFTGAFDRAAADLPRPRSAGRQARLLRAGFQTVDASFLDDLEQHRETLARSLKRANPSLDSVALTEVTQRILDRLVFLRFLEDKLIETEISVDRIAGSDAPWAEFAEAARRLDRRYNGAVYKPHPLIDQGRLRVDDRDFAGVCHALSAKESPYNFDAIPIHILGSIYERFLGKVIVATEKRARVEEKPEVRKAGGVYYTPEYIVRHIVSHTVGRLIAGKTPAQIARMRFADIACGSGSFLLAVYDELLRYHARWFNEHPAEAQRAGCLPADGGGWRLSLRQRREILLNNIFGVDIDRQAVEVTQVSLYLKLLEEETTASSHQYALQFRETLLPSLSRNIVCGNSLIETDILQGQIFPTEQERALNPLDMAAAFPEVMRAGGFDAIVGNPPYIRIQTLNETNPQAVAYFGRRYRSAAKGNYDIYVVFVERALQLLNPDGALGYILPHKFFNAKYGEGLRRLIAEGRHLARVVHFGDQQVFAGATTYTCLLFLDKRSRDEFVFEKVDDLATWAALDPVSRNTPHLVIPASQVSAADWTFVAGRTASLLTSERKAQTTLSEISDRIFQGPITGADPIFLFKEHRQIDDKTVEVHSKSLEEWIILERAIVKPVVRSGNIERYSARPTALVLFPYRVSGQRANLISPSDMCAEYPLAWKYLERNKKVLRAREKGSFGDNEWYRYSRTQNIGMWERPKLLVPYMTRRLSVYPDIADGFYFVNVTTGGYGITVTSNDVSLLYLCGLLNSRWLDWCFRHLSTTFHGGYFAANKQYIEQLPIRQIDFNNPADVARHDQMVSLVTQMLESKKRLAAAQTEGDTQYYTRRCESLDRQIDALVYELYDLTAEEIALVEGR